MVTPILVDWDLTLIFIGCFGCSCKIFIGYYEAVKQNRFKFDKTRIIFDIISIAFAGVFTNVIGSINPYQAFIFGASWDYLFTTALKQVVKKNGD